MKQSQLSSLHSQMRSGRERLLISARLADARHTVVQQRAIESKSLYGILAVSKWRPSLNATLVCRIHRHPERCTQTRPAAVSLVPPA